MKGKIKARLSLVELIKLIVIMENVSGGYRGIRDHVENLRDIKIHGIDIASLQIDST